MPERLRAIIADARYSADCGNHAYAAERFYEAADQARRIELPGELAYCLRHGAQASLEDGQCDVALAAAEEAAGIYTEIEKDKGLNFANSVRLVALAKERMGKSDEVRDHWTEARSIYDVHGIKAGVEECDAHLAH